jgi:hypothetical protein
MIKDDDEEGEVFFSISSRFICVPTFDLRKIPWKLPSPSPGTGEPQLPEIRERRRCILDDIGES